MSDSGVFVDKSNWCQYTWRQFDYLDWMVTNFDGGKSVGMWNRRSNDKKSKIYTHDDEFLAKAYGALYNQQMAIELAPSGWRLPSVDEWKELEGMMWIKRGISYAMNSPYHFNSKYAGVADITHKQFMGFTEYTHWWTSDKGIYCVWVNGSDRIDFKNKSGIYCSVRYVREHTDG